MPESSLLVQPMAGNITPTPERRERAKWLSRALMCLQRACMRCTIEHGGTPRFGGATGTPPGGLSELNCTRAFARCGVQVLWLEVQRDGEAAKTLTNGAAWEANEHKEHADPQAAAQVVMPPPGPPVSSDFEMRVPADKPLTTEELRLASEAVANIERATGREPPILRVRKKASTTTTSKSSGETAAPGEV